MAASMFSVMVKLRLQKVRCSLALGNMSFSNSSIIGTKTSQIMIVVNRSFNSRPFRFGFKVCKLSSCSHTLGTYSTLGRHCVRYLRLQTCPHDEQVYETNKSPTRPYYPWNQMKRNLPNYLAIGLSQHTSGNYNDKKASLKVFGLLAAFTIPFFKKDDEEVTIELLIAKAVDAEKQGYMNKAEDLYHQAITLAQQQNKQEKVIFIYDMMANFNLKINKFFKAEKLFKETIKLLLDAGYQQYDPAIIEISLKLAGIYELQYRFTEAEAGFRFCVLKSEEGIASFKEKREKEKEQENDQEEQEDREPEMNLYAMLGVSLDAFGKFMLNRKKLDEAEKAYLRAIGICQNELAEGGKPHQQTATILNDLGTVYEQKKNYSKAMETICKAEELARDSPDDLAVILCNKASLHLTNGDREEAAVLFRRALRLAQQTMDDETIMFVRRAMSKLAAPLKNKP